jgi:uncharacterized protein (TIGR02996 family)
VTDSSFLRTICANPDDDFARLAAAEFLEERQEAGDSELAEFVRVQVELAKCACEMIAAGVCLGCKNCHKLRRRERELLAQTHPETCPRCNPYITPPFVFTTVSKNGVAVEDCSECRGKRVVQVSNAVRWAGKLGGRTTVDLTSDKLRPNGFALSQGWRIAWPETGQVWGSEIMDPRVVYGRFVRGFIGAVSLSCAALVGRCQYCDHTFASPPGPHQHVHVGSLREELRRFPLTEIRISDKEPWEGEPLFSFYNGERSNIDHDDPTHPQSDLPLELFDDLEGHVDRTVQYAKYYATSATAESALSRAAVGWVRNKQEATV